MTELSVKGMCNKDRETSSHGVVASKLANAWGFVFVVCEQEFIVRHVVIKPREKIRLTFSIKNIFNKLRNYYKE